MRARLIDRSSKPIMERMDTTGAKFPKLGDKKRRNHTMRKKTLSKRRMVLALDRVARQEIVVERDANICQRCGRHDGEWIAQLGRCVVIQWCHVNTREYYITRWNADNSFAGCEQCHTWFDNHKVLSFDWFAKKFPERWERIKRILWGNCKTTDKDIRGMWRERCGKEQADVKS